MKKILIGSLVAASVMFGATAKSDIKPINDGPYSHKNEFGTYHKMKNCPNLSIQTSDIEISKGMEIGFNNTLPNMGSIVYDVLKNYNKTSDYLSYLNSDNLNELGATVVFGDLVSLKYESDEYNNDIEKKARLENEYKRLLGLVTPENKNWCNETMTQDTNRFINTEIRARIKNAEKLLKDRANAETISIAAIQCQDDSQNCFQISQNIKDVKIKDFAPLELDKNCNIAEQSLNNVVSNENAQNTFTQRITKINCTK